MGLGLCERTDKQIQYSIRLLRVDKTQLNKILHVKIKQRKNNVASR